LLFCQNIFIKNVVSRLTEHDDVITPLFRGAPRLGIALGPAPARAGPVDKHWCVKQRKQKIFPLAVRCFDPATGVQRLLASFLSSSDVVETVTSETETWLKFRDETETLS